MARLAEHSIMRGMLAGLMGALFLLPGTAAAHENHDFGSVFHDVPFGEACDIARDEFKLVCVYVRPKDESVPDYLETPSQRDWRTIDLLLRECVMTRYDPATAAANLDGEFDDAPLVVFADAEGAERFRLPGHPTPTELDDALSDEFCETGAVQRAREALKARGPDQPLARERLASVLARCGDKDAALREYMWCVRKGLRDRRNAQYAAGRRQLLFMHIAAFAKKYPPARDAIERERAQMEKLLLENDNANLARDLDQLNRSLGERKRSLELYTRLTEDHRRARHVLFDRIIDLLIEARRYEHVLKLVDPQRAFRQEVMVARRQKRFWNDAPESSLLRGQRLFAVGRGAAFVEALVATDQAAAGKELIDAIVRFDDADSTIAKLRQHAARAGNPEVLKYVENIAKRPAVDEATGEPRE